MITSIILTLLLLLVPVLSLRLLSLLPAQNTRPEPRSRSYGSSTRLLVILGSGGHTAEMLALLRNLDCSKYTHRSYIVSSGDDFSVGKAREFEGMLEQEMTAKSESTPSQYGTYDITVVPRARRIHQSLLSTPLTSLKCLLACFSVLHGSAPNIAHPSKGSTGVLKTNRSAYPDLILSNGPATGVIIILASFILRFVGAPGTKRRMRTVYVESWARVRSLSLSGKILLWVVDRFVVQWESMIPITGGKGEYYGALI